MKQTTIDSISNWLNKQELDIPKGIMEQVVANMTEVDTLYSASDQVKVMVGSLLVDYMLSQMPIDLQEDLNDIMNVLDTVS